MNNRIAEGFMCLQCCWVWVRCKRFVWKENATLQRRRRSTCNDLHSLRVGSRFLVEFALPQTINTTLSKQERTELAINIALYSLAGQINVKNATFSGYFRQYICEIAPPMLIPTRWKFFTPIISHNYTQNITFYKSPRAALTFSC